MAARYFTQASLDFLSRLRKNNNRDWFEANRQAYEDVIRSPALLFIEDMADDLAGISPHFLAVPKKVGGSLMRVYRDTRFAKDKTPYKTNIGIQFRHEMGKDVHAPGFYVHIEPKACFVGVGIWHPDAEALAKIRDAISNHTAAWKDVSRDRVFTRKFALSGDTLKNPPRGFSREHPMIDDLKRKDFIGISELSDTDAISSTFRKKVVTHFHAGQPFMQFLCKALELRC